MNKKGFTLVELIAIVALLSVIAVITIPNIGKQVRSNAQRESNQEVQAIENAARLYVAKHYANNVMNNETVKFTLQDLENDGLLKISDNYDSKRNTELHANKWRIYYGNIGILSVGDSGKINTSNGVTLHGVIVDIHNGKAKLLVMAGPGSGIIGKVVTYPGSIEAYKNSYESFKNYAVDDKIKLSVPSADLCKSISNVLDSETQVTVYNKENNTYEYCKDGQTTTAVFYLSNTVYLIAETDRSNIHN